jgi:hypothetical protein
MVECLGSGRIGLSFGSVGGWVWWVSRWVFCGCGWGSAGVVLGQVVVSGCGGIWGWGGGNWRLGGGLICWLQWRWEEYQMSVTNTTMRARDAVGRISARLSTGSLFSRGERSRSSTGRFERVVEAGRSNGVRPGLYKGRRDVGFDVEGLYCFLLERAERERAGGVDELCALFEGEVGHVPVGVRREARSRFEGLGISEASRGDDLRRVALVDVFVDALAGYCEDLEGQGEAALAVNRGGV